EAALDKVGGSQGLPQRRIAVEEPQQLFKITHQTSYRGGGPVKPACRPSPGGTPRCGPTLGSIDRCQPTGTGRMIAFENFVEHVPGPVRPTQPAVRRRIGLLDRPLQ